MALAHQFAQDGYQLVLAARGVAKMQALADELQRKFKVSVTVIAQTWKPMMVLHGCTPISKRGVSS